MSTRKKSSNFVQRLLKQSWRFFDAVTKAVVNWLLRSLLIFKRRSRLSRAGFVLPTVVMVVLVVTLLTTAIMIRSFDRSKNASNVRVDQAVLKAATPALDRARAKIERLFSIEETQLQGNTPPEANIADVLESSTYTLGDETPIKLVADFNAAEPKNKQLKTAWQFPVDSDNNGKFDTFTLYGIYFKNPLPNEDRARGTTEARALPQNDGQKGGCTSGNAGGQAGWFPVNGQLKKAFFTYVANVPITEMTGLDATKYEPYKGNKGFSALEMQLDQARTALDSNAVWYNDDLVISYIPSLRLNGRVHTNSNLLVTNPSGYPINFLQVSSLESCFYDPANAKIVVGGNVAPGDIGDSDSSLDTVAVDLYRGDSTPPQQTSINASNKTTTTTPSNVAGNSDAYAQRLNVLVQGALNLHDQNNFPGVAITGSEPAPDATTVSNVSNRYAPEIIKAFDEKFDPSNPGGARNALKQALETYFADRIRRVSFIEVPITEPDKAVTVNGVKQIAEITAPPGTTGQFVFSGGGQLTPPRDWMMIQDPNSGDVTNYTKIPLNFAGGGMDMPATDPADVGSTKIESNIGDRVLVGNNLPHIWVKDASTTPVTYAKEGEKQPVKNGTNDVAWNNTGGGVKGGSQRQRKGLADQLDDIGDTSRNGFWETAAAKVAPLDNEDLAGGLRVVTGAGIYVDDAVAGQFGAGFRLATVFYKGPGWADKVRSFLPIPPTPTTIPTELGGSTAVRDTDYKVVWPDTMPMYQWNDKPDTAGNPTPTVRDPVGTASQEQLKGDLQMRATVVYHYKTGDAPIACISSYYDPTDPYTADNANGISNNGLNYPLPADRSATIRLRNQAKMVFPDGRWVNKPLYDAIQHLDNGTLPPDLSLSDKAAIDAANCAFSILGGAAPTGGGTVPDGAIKERAFLDARQIKALHKPTLESDGTTPISDNTLITDIGNPDQFKNPELNQFATQLTDKYTMPIEQRQPLEVRVTEIDLNALRTVTIGTGGGSGANSTQDYLLPNSGIIYATRDDALPDISSSDRAATDFKLDPTRRPNGIRLINGSNLERVNTYRSAEKGLILAADVPVYIKGDFNLHRESGSTSGTLEEFSTPVTFGSGTNTGNFYNRSDTDYRFACRKDAPTKCTGNGDQWRAARILSDAITLLSADFRDGFRYEGDYDLSNHVGNPAVESFLKNGFWLNNFATTAQWYQTTGSAGFPRTDFAADPDGKQVGSSYVMNAVTPIQRRVRFPAYKMEMCKKLLVSECSPTDWLDPNNAPLLGLMPDTSSEIDPATPRPTPLTEDQRYALEHYPRRVAFKRDPLAYGQLVLDTTNPIPHAQPITVDGTAQTYGAALDLNPLLRDNALWFATTTDPANPSADLQYNGANLLYYAEEPEVPVPTTQPKVHEQQLLLPGTPTFPKEFQTLSQLVFKGPTNQTILNGATANDPSDFAVCIRDGSGSKDYQVSDLTPGICSSALTNIQNMRQYLSRLAQGSVPNNILSVKNLDTTPQVGPADNTLKAKATAKVNVFDLDALFPTSGPPATRLNLQGTIKVDKGDQSDPIFIFRRLPGRNINFNGVRLQLAGVDPNNIFWVTGGKVNVLDNPANLLTGTFLGGSTAGTASLTIANGAQIKGGRFLGFDTATITPFKALTTTAQPLVVPVLQVHSPEGTPADPWTGDINVNWLQQAPNETTVNAVLVMGDTPARPVVDSTGATVGAESNGGLGNFPRFLEAWSRKDSSGNYDGVKTAKISGGFIQFKRSAFASAPFEAFDDTRTDTSLFFDGTPTPAYRESRPPTVPGYRYPGGSSGDKAGYYMPPDRQWGYDVGLLSQTPDLFSRQFVTPQAGTPNEFYREVSRDDGWVKTLMCGAKDPTGAGTSYNYALPAGQRPTDCRPISEYN